YSVGMGLAPIHFPKTLLLSWMGASPIPTEELRKKKKEALWLPRPALSFRIQTQNAGISPSPG
ncbi:MAG TPA: hypothetical protein VGT82_08125, partial [Ktedonobacteraceae bacterium]|nr:hypothetical protein [Ktedonobacteraceae bacterium]